MAKFVNSACCWGIRGWHPLRFSEGSASSLLRCLVISDHCLYEYVSVVLLCYILDAVLCVKK